MTAPELKPCPFCGGVAYMATGMKGDGSPWNYVECEVCAASAEPDEWNNRTDLCIHRDDPVLRQVMEASSKMQSAVREVSRLGAQTGPQWTKLTVASLAFNQALAAMQELIGGNDAVLP